MSAAPRIAVVRGPGGLPGLDVHAGAWFALEKLGVKPTWLSGCSAGAIASAMHATGMSASHYAKILCSLDSRDVVKKRRFWRLRAAFADSIADPAPIQKLLAEHLPYHFDGLKIPCTVSATQMLPAGQQPMLFSHGPFLREAVLASMSIAGFWPYAKVPGNVDECGRLHAWSPGGRWFSDGGTTCQYPLPPRLDDYDHVVVLDPIRRTPFSRRDENVLSRLRWNVEALAQAEGLFLQMQHAGRGNLHWVELDMGDASTLKFNHEALFESAYAATMQRLAEVFA